MGLFELYLLTVIPSFGGLLRVLGVVGVVASSLASIVYFMAKAEEFNEEKVKKLEDKYGGMLKKAFITFPIIILLSALFPSKQDMYFIGGGYIAIEATKVDGVDKLPANVVKALNTFLEGFEVEEGK